MICNTSKQNQNRSWYLAVTKPQSEFKAQEIILRQCYETYLPLVQTSRRRNSENINRTEAFSSRYLFILLDKETDNWCCWNGVFWWHARCSSKKFN